MLELRPESLMLKMLMSEHSTSSKAKLFQGLSLHLRFASSLSPLSGRHPRLPLHILLHLPCESLLKNIKSLLKSHLIVIKSDEKADEKP